MILNRKGGEGRTMRERWSLRNCTAPCDRTNMQVIGSKKRYAVVSGSSAEELSRDRGGSARHTPVMWATAPKEGFRTFRGRAEAPEELARKAGDVLGTSGGACAMVSVRCEGVRKGHYEVTWASVGACGESCEDDPGVRIRSSREMVEELHM